MGHRYGEQAAACGIAEIGVKLFKTTRDACRAARQVLPFHSEHIHRLPGPPNDHVQQSLGGGMYGDGQGVARYYVIQEWVNGETLEELIRRRWSGTPIDGGYVCSLLTQLFGGIIIPLWSAGTVWWDVRDANYCWDAAGNRLVLIDTDALAAYRDEILSTPGVWVRRDKGQATALTRLRGLVLRLMLVQGRSTARKAVEAAVGDAWRVELEPALRALGREPVRRGERQGEAMAALQRFLARLDQGPISTSR